MAVNLSDFAIAIVVLGIVASISSVILVKMATSQVDSLGSYLVKNETISLGGDNTLVGWCKSVDLCINGTTNNNVISSGNYSVTYDADFGFCRVTNTSNQFSTVPWACSYTTYNTSDPRYALPSNAATGLAEYGNWFKILVIVAVATVVLGLIFMAFGKSGGSSGDGFEGSAY